MARVLPAARGVGASPGPPRYDAIATLDGSAELARDLRAAMLAQRLATISALRAAPVARSPVGRD